MPADDVRFVTLADAIRPRTFVAAPPPDSGNVLIEAAAAATIPVEVASPQEQAGTIRIAAEPAAALRAARLFRAAVGDVFETVLSDLAHKIAIEIVARELRLEKVDLAAIARRLLAERFAQEPLRIRVAPADAAVACDLPVTVDPALQAGDAVLECRDGDIDARLGVRLASVLAGLRP